MNRAIQYYAMIKSGWLPDNIKDTFFPFFMTLIYHDSSSLTVEDLSHKFEDKYGFNISHFIMSYLVEKAIKEKCVEIHNDKINIVKDNIKNKYLIDEGQIDEQNARIIDFLSDFVKHCNETEINLDKAYEILDLFLKRYDFSIISSAFDFSEDEQNVFMYFFIDYVKKIHHDNPQQYNTLVSICEGNMIRSMLLNDSIEINNIYKGQCIFLDTPVVLQVLGFCGEYLEREYKFLVSSWIKQGANVYVYSHTLQEIDELLHTAERFVESSEIDISKSSNILLYFREQRYKKSDVRQIIVQLNELLNENIISIYDNIDIDDQYSENEEEIKTAIIEQYRLNPKNDRDYENATFINYDVKSIWNTYMLRKNNNVRQISESKALFITNNRGIVAAINSYNSKYYKFSLSPVIRDTYIGMLVVANNLCTTTDYVSRNLIAVCTSAYKPTNNVKQNYLRQVDELKNKTRITETDYFLLKNFPEVSDLLTQKTLGFTEDLSDSVIFEMLNSIKMEIIQDEKKQMQEEIKNMELEKQKELDDIKRISDSKIKESQDQHINDRIKYAINNYKKYHLVVMIIYYVLYAAVLFGTIYIWIYNVQNHTYGDNKISIIFLSFLCTVYTFVIILEQASKKGAIVKYILNRKKMKLAIYYNIDVNQIN